MFFFNDKYGLKKQQRELKKEDKLIKMLNEAREQYKIDKDALKCIKVYEYVMIKKKFIPGITHVKFLMNLYSKTKQYDKTVKFNEMIK